ncbi:hypothetical protein PINS_up004577 [Pythium insidiosum]|nr:hypothetical protein PINS_up004577 [Pythium insidiosum]
MKFEARRGGIFVDGERFHVKGISYFGMESDILVPHGLWGGPSSTTLDRVAQQLCDNGFNLVRLPLAVDAVLRNTTVDSHKIGNEAILMERFMHKELRYLDVLDHAVATFARHSLLVLLDMHVLNAGGPITPLWYEGEKEENQDDLKLAWQSLASRYAQAWNVIGADVKNEPHGEATWGTNTPAHDWRLCAEAVGTVILETCPRWLIFVEGIQESMDTYGSSPSPASFWGGNLSAARDAPVRLPVPHRLVLSPHVYGPSVAHQDYFVDPAFPSNLPSIWNAHFGFLLDDNRNDAPVVVGEWGGSCADHHDKLWHEAFTSYLAARQIDSIYWCVNPNSHDTRGILEDDWNTLCRGKTARPGIAAKQQGHAQLDAEASRKNSS